MSGVLKLSSPEGEFWEIQVLYEDADLLALDKPAGLLSTPEPTEPHRPSLLALLHAGIKQEKPWATARGWGYLMVAHRLDPEISGIILLAKCKPALVTLADLFGSEKPLQTFLALVQGRPAEDRFRVDGKLATDPARPNLVRVDAQRGRRASTLFAVREQFKGWTLIQCEPLTQRLQQVRAHLSSLGLPVVADRTYGGRPLLLSRLKPAYRLKPKHIERPLIGRPALHAEQLSLAHPVTGAALAITAPPPKDLQVAIKYLRRYALG